MLRSLAIASVLSSAGLAHADLTRCAKVDGQVSYTAGDLPDMKADTGWFPNGYAAQLRITGQVIGETAVAMGLTPTACWDNGMQITVPGVAQTGWLDSEYGADVDIYGQIHTSVLGYQIDWSGKIPLPYWLPTDFLMAGSTTFDPVVLGGSEISVTSDPTSQVIVVSTDVLSDLISLGSISGGLQVAVQGQLATSYSTSTIAVGGGAFARDGEHVTIAKPDRGFGATLDTTLSAKGVLHYEPYVIFSVLFDVKIFGIRVVAFNLASVTLPLPVIDRPISLDGGKISIPLPHLDQIPTSLGFASGASQPLALHNAGAAALEIAVAQAPAGVTASATTIAPGADATITVTAADPTMLSGALELATNDPNYPSLTVSLDPAHDGETTMPASPDPEASGCTTGGGVSHIWLVLALVTLRRRRR